MLLLAVTTALLFVAVAWEATGQSSWTDGVIAFTLAIFLITPVLMWSLYPPRRQQVSSRRLVATTAFALGAALISLLVFTGDLLPTALLMTAAGLLQGGLIVDLSPRRASNKNAAEATSSLLD